MFIKVTRSAAVALAAAGYAVRLDSTGEILEFTPGYSKRHIRRVLARFSDYSFSAGFGAPQWSASTVRLP